jgi:capsule polysaccharide export protein KpsE/RkpR
VITIVVRDRSPQRAAELTHAYTDELDRLMNRVSTSSARQERIFIEQRLTAMKDELTTAEKALGQYSSQKMILNVQDQTKAMVGSLADLQGQLIVAQSQLEGLQQLYTNNNSRVKQLRATVDGLREQIKKLGGTQADLTHPESLTAGDLYPPVRQMPLLGVQWLDLYRRAKTSEAAYELLAQQYELARLQEAREIPTVKVIDAPEVPERKAWPPRTLIVSASAVTVLFLFVGWIMFRMWRSAEGEPVVVRYPPPTREIPARLRQWVATRRLSMHSSDFSGDTFRA